MSAMLFSGNGFGPSLQSSIARGTNMIPLLNGLGTDAAVIGIHDLEYGVNRFIDLIGRCEFPWLASNIVCSDDKTPIPGTVSTAILSVPDMPHFKIGLIGLVEEDWLLSSLQSEGLSYLDCVEVSHKLSKSLRQSCNFIIALTHMRQRNDVALAEATQGVLDLIVSGYSLEGITQNIGKIPIVRNSNPKQLSYTRIAVTVLEDGKFEVDSNEINITSEYLPDQDLSDVATRCDDIVVGLLDEIVIRTDEDLNCESDFVRANEAPIGNLVADAMRFAFKRLPCDIAILPSGCIRPNCTFEKGPLSMADIFSVIPTEDPVVVVEVSAVVLLSLLEHGFEKLPETSNDFPQVSGLEMVIDSGRPPGSRIREMSIVSANGTKLPIDMTNGTKLFTVATPAFLAYGRDGSTFLASCRKRIPEEEGIILPSLFQNFLMSSINELGQIKPVPSGRIIFT
eukprot:TRINITY_DN18369_c0_g1_i1.p1 TRINITY_DN18369_c0_g1~~TRINITY_DN18369_c0_g1_i1.p1  ORF type:complete len:486 (+),score=77.75 TRINITY_DN18369_c0_g1_i1:103-1458(+)